MTHSLNESRKHRVDSQTIDLRNLALWGRTLDIGGGGEGIIGQISPENTVAIDQSAEELSETPEGPLKIVMNATNLTFLPNSFDTVTLFYTLLFIPLSEHEKVFLEIKRVLKPRGRLLIWDVNIPCFDNGERDIFCFPMQVLLPSKTVRTGYGTLWPQQQYQNQETIKEQLLHHKFSKVTEQSINNLSFFLEFEK